MAGDEYGDDSIREEFLAEANEIVEALSRDLLVLDQGKNERTTDLINEIFRGVHTLKGMAGMFGFHTVGSVAHVLENLLDDLRLGRVELSREVLDVLFEGVENFQRMLSSKGVAEDHEVGEYTKAIERVSAAQAPTDDPLTRYELDPSVLSVLTEYEEHRLRTNILEDVPLFRLEVSYPLTTIDVSLEELKRRAKPLGEIITYLPSVGEGGSDRIDLHILLASRAGYERLSQDLCTDGGRLFAVPLAGDAGPMDVVQIDTLPPAPVAASVPSVSLSRRPAGPQGLTPSGAPGAGDVLEPTQMRAGGHSVRVDIRKLDHLMNVVGEMSLTRAAIEGISDRIQGWPEFRTIALELLRINRVFERSLGALQEGILGVRMVPLRQLFDRLARGVRQVAREHDKEIRFVVSGSETELDKLIVEELADPLMHIIRNAVDHGIERPRARESAGKTPIGTLAINAYQKGSNVVIEIEDDGAGIDVQRLSAAAIRKGLVSAQLAAEMDRDELLALIFAPGISTAESVTDTSGRGVGMDVVKHNISRLGGVVDVQSDWGTNTKFTITLPITLAIIRALVVRSVDEIFTIPLTVVREALLLDRNEVHWVDGREVISLRGVTLPLCRIDRQLGIERSAPPPRGYVVVVNVGQRALGLVVDELLDQQDVVIKALGESLSSVRGFAGAAELGGLRVALMLDVPTLVEEALSGPALVLSGEHPHPLGGGGRS